MRLYIICVCSISRATSEIHGALRHVLNARPQNKLVHLVHFAGVYIGSGLAELTFEMEPVSMNEIDGDPKILEASEITMRSAMTYQPRDDDVIIVTYPKCGTKWTQYIVSNILIKDNVPQDPVEYMRFAPNIDYLGAEAAVNPARKGPLRTHFPLNRIVFAKHAKYICVARNPFDCCVSYYHSVRGVTPKNEANVFFLTYEQLSRDTENMIIKMADFLGADYGSALRKDKALLQNVLQACSLENMRAVFNYGPLDLIRIFAELPPERSLKSMEPHRKRVVPTEEMHHGSGFVRKGTVGDWKNHFTQQQIAEMKAWIEEKTEGSDVMDLWKDVDLP
ncbi:hypothetical protein MTO96_041296 [Rhipicephalus appendiculatus]